MRDGADVNALDDEGVSALHWAAINGHDHACQWLLDHGANVHLAGGTLHATPLQWAARRGHAHVMSLLLSHGADPLARDAQGFHALHLATHSHQVLAVLYLLQVDAFRTPANLDSRDPQGHTALMWAAFQGDALSVDVLLRHGANVHCQDVDGLTPLHWAVVHGSAPCIERLVTAGADLGVRENKGQTPHALGRELGSHAAFHRAMAALRLHPDGTPVQTWRSPRRLAWAVAVLPFCLYGVTFYMTSLAPWWLAPWSFIGGVVGTHVFMARVVLRAQTTHALQSTTYFLSLLGLSLAYVGMMLGAYVGPALHAPVWTAVIWAHLALVVSGLVYCVRVAPGACAQPASPAARRDEILALAARNELHATSYCVSCLARRPLRAKHCFVCKQCVARHDHHCPWIANCGTCTPNSSRPEQPPRVCVDAHCRRDGHQHVFVLGVPVL